MQFKNDPIPIRTLNNDEDYHLLDQPDPEGRLLAASLVGRITEQPFHFAELGNVEILASAQPFCAFLALKVDGKTIAAAESVWEPFVSESAWAGLNKFHQIVAGNRVTEVPSIPSTTPWLGISFFAIPFQRLTTEQQAIAIAFLWGRTYRLRQHAQLSVLSN